LPDSLYALLFLSPGRSVVRQSKEAAVPRRKKPVLGVDYIMDYDGHAQFTREYLIKQGFCCNAGCRYCPYLNSIGESSPTSAPNHPDRRVAACASAKHQ
jgi:hypothetical protein